VRRITPILILWALIALGCGAGTRYTLKTPHAPVERLTSDVAVQTGLSLALDGRNVTLSWEEWNPGDFNTDGAVNGLDVFPLASRFGQASDETPGNECVDGNHDGTLDGLDLFVIAVNFQHRMAGSFAYVSRYGGGFDDEPVNTEPFVYAGCGEPRQVQATIPEGVPSFFAVRCFEEILTELGPPSVPVTEPWVGWRLTLLDDSGDNGFGSSMLLDSQNNPSITYCDETLPDERLKYAWFAEDQWNLEYIDTADATGYWTQLARDGKGETQIAYVGAVNHDGYLGNLKFARGNPGDWRTETIDAGGNVRGWTTLRLDADERPVIGYLVTLDETYSAIKLAVLDNDIWNIETVFEEVGQPIDCSMDLAPDGGTWFSFTNGLTGGLKVAEPDGASWTVSTVDSTIPCFYSHMGFDGSTPVITYTKGFLSTSLNYASFDGPDWQTQQIGSARPLMPLSLAFDEDGHPAMAYEDANMLKLARWNGSQWSIETIDEIGSETSFTCRLLFDLNGYPLIVYRRDPSGEMLLGWEF